MIKDVSGMQSEQTRNPFPVTTTVIHSPSSQRSSRPTASSPEDVLPHSVESRDILIVDDVCVQRRLRHQVGPRQGRVHQGVAWGDGSISTNTILTTGKGTRSSLSQAGQYPWRQQLSVLSTGDRCLCVMSVCVSWACVCACVRVCVCVCVCVSDKQMLPVHHLW